MRPTQKFNLNLFSQSSSNIDLANERQIQDNFYNYFNEIKKSADLGDGLASYKLAKLYEQGKSAEIYGTNVIQHLRHCKIEASKYYQKFIKISHAQNFDDKMIRNAEQKLEVLENQIVNFHKISEQEIKNIFKFFLTIRANEIFNEKNSDEKNFYENILEQLNEWLKKQKNIELPLPQFIDVHEKYVLASITSEPQNTVYQELGLTEEEIIENNFPPQSMRYLAESTYGKVYHAVRTVKIYDGNNFDQNRNINIAIKVYKNSISSEKFKHEFLNEVNLFKRMSKCDYIVQYYGVNISDINKPQMMMEYMSRGSLSIFIKGSPMSLQKRLDYICDILVGLNFLHQHHIVHNDLKADNVLVDQNNRAKIADFGTAVDLKATDINGKPRLENRGTLRWLAPERYKGVVNTEESVSTFKSDMYSFGCLCFEIVANKVPWEDQFPRDTDGLILLTYLIKHYEYNCLVPGGMLRDNIQEQKPRIPLQLSIFMNNLTSHDPRVRYSASGAQKEFNDSILPALSKPKA